MTLQDVTGQNRLTENTDFRDGFSVKMSPQPQGSGQKDETVSSSFGWSQKVLYFNEETNTIYYEFNITTDPNSPLADPLKLSSFLIYFDEVAYVDEPVDLFLEEIGGSRIAPITEEYIWGGTGLPDDLSSFTQVLEPSYFAEMPHGQDDQWVSNVGIIDGRLHIQIGKVFNKEFGSNDISLVIVDQEGNIFPTEYELTLLGNKDNQLLNLEENDYSDAVYKYEEAVFSVDTDDLSGYTLYFNGSVSSGVEGSWKVKAGLSDSDKNMRIWENDIIVEGHLFKNMTLSPLGLQVIGTYEGENCLAYDMSVAVETIDGIIPLEGGGGSENSKKHTFSLSWNTETPLDVGKATALIINGTRIPIK